VAVPRGRAHGFRNASGADARLTMMFTPAGYENYFRDVARAAADGEPITPELLAELRGRQQTVAATL
jgi:oxalate decarboxylase/phosphoglucose isomerase-like protein (cupin superfamily)